ncbi:MAG: hypothetical protein DMF93_21105 [Acidobacteria bacterium]|nr:MAG: hypothetical protein DMF93_21105 [Acidobacteriota bacterium]
MEAGTTSQGRPMYFALVSTPENLGRIDHYREIARRLAHPQGLTDAEAHRLAREGKAFVHIDGGLHSTEVAGWSHTPQLLFDLVSRANEPDVKAILENVVLFLWPTINPDGQQMVAEWYMRNVGTPYELSALPRLYQEYVGHDNNRDAYMLNMIESRVLEHTWRQWEPQIIYVHHQSGPFPTRIWLPPYVDYAPNFKNIASFWTETALYQYATPHDYTLADFPQNMRDLRPQSLYSSPWQPGRWRLRDAVEYMETASLAVLEYAAKYKESLLYDRYQAGRDQIALGRKQAPYAYVIPQQQRDPVAAVELLRRIAFGGIRVSTLTAEATIDGEMFPAGTWVIPTDQEFAAMAREILDVQRYPDLRQYPGGPPERPYDAAGCRRDAGAESEADAVRTGAARGRGGVRQRTRRRLQQRSVGGSDRAGGRTHRRLGRRARPRSGAEQHVQSDQSRLAAGGDGAGERRRGRRADPLHRARDLRERAGGDRPLARAAGGADAVGAGPRDPQAADWIVPAVDRQHGRRLVAVGARAVRLFLRRRAPGGFRIAARRSHRRAHHRRRRARPDRGRAGGRPRRRRAAPGVRLSADAAGSAASRSVRTRRRHARLPEQRQRLRDPAAEAPGAKRRRRPARGRILPARIRRRSVDRSVAPRDGGDAGEGGGVRRRQPGLRAAARIHRHGDRAVSGIRIAALVGILDRRGLPAREGGGARRAARRRARRADRIPPRMARTAIRDVSSVVQRGVVRPVRNGVSTTSTADRRTRRRDPVSRRTGRSR